MPPKEFGENYRSIIDAQDRRNPAIYVIDPGIHIDVPSVDRDFDNAHVQVAPAYEIDPVVRAELARLSTVTTISSMPQRIAEGPPQKLPEAITDERIHKRTSVVSRALGSMVRFIAH